MQHVTWCTRLTRHLILFFFFPCAFVSSRPGDRDDTRVATTSFSVQPLTLLSDAVNHVFTAGRSTLKLAFFFFCNFILFYFKIEKPSTYCVVLTSLMCHKFSMSLCSSQLHYDPRHHHQAWISKSPSAPLHRLSVPTNCLSAHERAVSLRRRGKAPCRDASWQRRWHGKKKKNKTSKLKQTGKRRQRENRENILWSHSTLFTSQTPTNVFFGLYLLYVYIKQFQNLIVLYM